MADLSIEKGDDSGAALSLSIREIARKFVQYYWWQAVPYPSADWRAAWTARAPHYERGYGRLFLDHVLQANEGCDFDFLRGKTPVRAEDTAGPSHS